METLLKELAKETINDALEYIESKELEDRLTKAIELDFKQTLRKVIYYGIRCIYHSDDTYVYFTACDREESGYNEVLGYSLYNVLVDYKFNYTEEFDTLFDFLSYVQTEREKLIIKNLKNKITESLEEVERTVDCY